MKRNNFFSRFIVVTLTAALLLVSGGRAIRVSALADPVQAISPVFDTQIIQLQDYIEHGGMTDPQLDIFYFLTGALVAGQLGAQDAKLVSPYPNENSVKEWLINCGIQLYNTLIGLVPSGDYYVGIDYPTKGISRDQIKALVAMMMGNAVVAANYTDLDTYLSDNPDSLYIPFNKDIQLGVNAVLGLNGGALDWQDSVKPFTSTVAYRTQTMTQTLQNSYASNVLSWSQPLVRFNYLYYSEGYDGNGRASADIFSTYHNMFIKPSGSNAFIYFADDNGNLLTANTYPIKSIFTYGNDNNRQISVSSSRYFNFPKLLSNYANYSTLKDMVQAIYNFAGNYTDLQEYRYYFEDFVKHVYFGNDWNSKVEVFNSSDLNLYSVVDNYYQQVQNDYLLDIRGLISDLVGVTDIINQIKNNLYDLTGIIELNPKFINVSIDLPDLSLLVDPPVPVDLNDIAELTDNSYLERVKEHARNAGDIFANYVAFWHNCDSDLVYTVFGAAILVLVGAFVGKWGHS